jgi:hypothetical protein
LSTQGETKPTQPAVYGMRLSDVPSRHREFLLHIAICAVLGAPFFLFRDIPLFDLPLHIAREHILFDPKLAIARQYYLPDWRLVPNMAIDAAVYLMHLLVPVDFAIRIFLAGTAIQLYLGAVALNRSLFGPQARFGVYAALFVFNGPFMLGLVNLSFATGLSLWVFALWIKGSERRHGWILFALLACLILMAHLFAFGVYALVLGTYALARAVARVRDPARRGLAALQDLLLEWIRDCAHLLVPIGLYLLLMRTDLGDVLVVPSSIRDKLWALVTITGIYNLKFEIAFLGALACGAILLYRKLTICRLMLLPLAALLAAFLLLPFQIGPGSWVDYRVPATLTLFLIASTNWRGAPRTQAAVDALMLILLGVRMGVMFLQWASWQPIYQEYRAAFRQMPLGAKLLPISPYREGIVPLEHPPLAHMDALAVIERGSFVPAMAASLPHELLVFAPGTAMMQREFRDHPALRDYDYVLIIHPREIAIPPGLRVLTRGQDFVLAQVPH